MINKIKVLSAIVAIAFLMTGCATKGWFDKPANCALAGAAIGGGAGLTDEDHDSAALVGAIGGAIVGATVCALMADGDADGDGVSDSKDQCPNSAPGVKVDALGCELDSDGDGVVDSKDQCPNTPAGAKVNASGCELDSDGDGVVDSRDQCPSTPQGVSVGSNGCALDSDGDGVPDYKDQCPNTPAGAAVNALGCQAAAVLEGVLFKLNSAELTDASKTKLNENAAKLNYSKGVSIEISGHTDSTGSAAYNKSLSQRRAESVLNYLVNQGVSRDDLTAVGYGEEKPVATNSTAEGRQENRRVELNTK